MRTVSLIVTAIAAVALTGAGCGEEEATDRAARAKPAAAPETAEQRVVRQRTEAFLQAMSARADAEACRMMTRTLQTGITFSLERRALPGDCRTRAAHIYSTAKAPGNPGARVKTVRIDGTKASVTAAAGEVESEIKLQKVAGNWKIADF